MILHVIHSLNGGGASRSLLALASRAEGEHHIVTLVRSESCFVSSAQARGLRVYRAPDQARIAALMKQADIIQLHYWNTPEMSDFLAREWPPSRLLVRLHIAGDTPSQVVTRELVQFSDLCAAGCPRTRTFPHLQGLAEKIVELPPAADFSRLEGFEARAHIGFQVGYLGTVDFVKMHPDLVEMSSTIEVPDIVFQIRGSGAAHSELRSQAHRLGMADRFEIGGYLDEVRDFFAGLDCFGYPLRKDTYATADLVLHEAMYCGVPPVVLAHGGPQHTVVHDQTGLVAADEESYCRAIEFLYHNPQERRRLSANAKSFAHRHLGADNLVQQLNRLYDKLMEKPKATRQWSAPGSGSGRFLASLSPYFSDFQESLSDSKLESVMKADARIAEASPVLTNPGGGGLLHYRSYYPKDPNLRFWTGLVLRRWGESAKALLELKTAQLLGFSHYRVHLYLAELAESLGDSEASNTRTLSSPITMHGIQAAQTDVG